MTNFIGEARSSTSARARALKGVALSAVAMAIAVPGYAQAQQAGDVQEVTVTGSRIKAPNLTSDSPVTAVSAEAIKQQGTTNIETLLNTLPAVTADLSNVGYGFGGVANLDLRALGSVRTLVLIDGQRIGPSSASNPAPDVNFIPAALVKSIDVLTGGASAVYGSDAVAGVVNFHLLNNFEGVMYDTTFSGYQHDNNNPVQSVLSNGVGGVNGAANPGTIKFNKGATWDGFVRDNTVAMGVNAPENKGNITIWGEYRATTPVVGPQRDTSACAVTFTTSAPGKTCAGSSTGVYGHFTPPAAVKTKYGLPASITLADNPDGSETFVKFGNTLKYNFAGTSYEQSQDDRTSFGATGHYQVAPWGEFYSNFMFMKDSNLNQIGPNPITTDAGGGFVNVAIPCSQLGTAPSPDPSLKGLSQQQLMGCNGSTGTSTVQVPAIREQIPRQTEIDTYRYRAVAGLRGDISTAWSYDASVNVFKTQETTQYYNYPGVPQLTSAYTTAGAFAWNEFNPGLQATQESGLSEAALMTDQTTDYDVVASVSGDLGEYGLTSPWAKNGAAVVLGVEYRRSEVTRDPDSAFALGELVGASGEVPAFRGAEANREIFSEFRAPLVEDKPFVKALDLNLSFRHTETAVENSGNSFSANTYKVAMDWAPDNQVRFRGSYNKADRAPNTYELFQPFNPYGGLGGGQDPCAAGGSASLATCTSSALPAGARVSAADYGRANCNSGQCNLNIGGNLALKPEKAETWTWGVNLTPDFVPGLIASVDYWDIKIDNYISTLGASTILNGCYSGLTNYCQYIHRGADGNLDADGSVDDNLQNLDSFHTTGIDVDLGYHKNLGDLGLDGAGAIDLSLVGTYLLTQQDSVIASQPTYDCAGYMGSSCGVPSPHWRHTFRATWVAPWGQDVSLAWRYIGGTLYDANSPKFPTYNGGGANYDAVDAKIPAYSYFDLSTSYVLWDKYTFRVGVNNLFDKDPPVLAFVYGNFAGSLPGATINSFSTYDTLGRQIFMNFNAKF